MDHTGLEQTATQNYGTDIQEIETFKTALHVSAVTSIHSKASHVCTQFQHVDTGTFYCTYS